jgi:hypothetical protein
MYRITPRTEAGFHPKYPKKKHELRESKVIAGYVVLVLPILRGGWFMETFYYCATSPLLILRHQEINTEPNIDN